MNFPMTAPPPAWSRVAIFLPCSTVASVPQTTGAATEKLMAISPDGADPAFDFHHFSSWQIPAPARCGPELVVTKEETYWISSTRTRSAAHRRTI